MRSDETGHHHHGNDLRCRTCGSEVEVPHLFDTRGHHYCAPDCWENVGTARPQAGGHAAAH